MISLSKFFHRNSWLIPLSVYLYGFSVSALIAAISLPYLLPMPENSDIPGYSTLFDSFSDFPSLLTLWDGQWYRYIAVDGYEQNYDLTSGDITNWAFFPLYPLLIKALMFLGVPFWLAGSLLSISCTIAAFFVIFRLAYSYSGSLWVGFFSLLPLVINPAFFTTMSTYTEGASLLIVSLVLYGLVKKNLWLTTIALLLAGVIRGIGVPLFALVFIVIAVEIYKNRRLVKRHMVLLAAAAFAAGFWPIMVAVNLGSPTASLQLLSLWTSLDKYPLWVPVLAAALVLLLHSNRKLPWQWTLWSVIYIFYITATTVTSEGLIRYFLMALAPLPLVVNWIPARYRVAIYSVLTVIVLALGFQGTIWWFSNVWIVTSPFYTNAIP